MYRNIIFDIGGVVVNYNPKDFLMERFFSEGVETTLYNASFGSAEWRKLDNGEMTWLQASDIFLRRGREKGLEIEMQAVIDEWWEMLTTRKATVALMRLLKRQGFSLYYLTNISHEVLGLLSKRKFWALFDGGVASCQAGIGKPHVEIYQQLLDEYNLVARETIFTDDTRENAAAAFQAGITGIQFKSVKDFCKTLVTHGIEV